MYYEQCKNVIMWWIIFLYVVPGMFNTMVLPPFIDYNGGIDYLNSQINEELTLKQAVGLMSFVPIINIICALLLVWWLITCTLNS